MQPPTEAYAFLRQNAVAAGTLATEEELDAVATFAEHHAGGLFVLGRFLDDGRYCKMHDSWGDDGRVVVHAYDPEADDSERESERYFDTGSAALRYFLDLDAHIYCVGLPVTVIVRDGAVTYEVDLSEASSAIKEDTAVPIDEDGDPLYTDEQVDADAERVEAAVAMADPALPARCPFCGVAHGVVGATNEIRGWYREHLEKCGGLMPLPTFGGAE